jgi:hypothetical protein
VSPFRCLPRSAQVVTHTPPGAPAPKAKAAEKAQSQPEADSSSEEDSTNNYSLSRKRHQVSDDESEASASDGDDESEESTGEELQYRSQRQMGRQQVTPGRTVSFHPSRCKLRRLLIPCYHHRRSQEFRSSIKRSTQPLKPINSAVDSLCSPSVPTSLSSGLGSRLTQSAAHDVILATATDLEDVANFESVSN